jgi:hypothetical protein
MSLLEHAPTALAGIACLLASGAFVLSLRNPASAVTPVAVIATPTAPEPPKGDVTEDAEDKDKKKDDKSDIIDNAYKRIHQRYNRKDYKWEDFDPLSDTQIHEGVIFIVYHRHYEPMAVRPLERIVEVHSESLKDVLRTCIKHIDTVFDPKPMV